MFALGRTLVVTTREEGYCWVETREVAKYPTVLRTDPRNQKLSGPKWQRCPGREPLVQGKYLHSTVAAFMSGRKDSSPPSSPPASLLLSNVFSPKTESISRIVKAKNM